jgi:hypothetical protein
VLGLPDLVRHFCFVHFLRDFCGFFSAISLYTPRLRPCIVWRAFVLF